MDIFSQNDLDGARYRLAGALNFRDRDVFAAIITDAGNGHGRTIRLDLRELARIDSFGIGLFLVAHEAAQAAGNKLLVENVQGDVARVFHLGNLDVVLCLDAPLAEKPRAIAPRPAARLEVNLVPRAGDKGEEFFLSGRFTFADRTLFEALIPVLLDCAGPWVVLDMSNLEFMDSAGLSMILIAREECQKRGLFLTLRQPGPRVAQLFRLSALDDLLS